MSGTLSRERALDLARAQECLRQARNLAQTAASLLNELSFDGEGNARDESLDLRSEIKLASDVTRSCQDGVDRLDRQLKRTPIP